VRDHALAVIPLKVHQRLCYDVRYFFIALETYLPADSASELIYVILNLRRRKDARDFNEVNLLKFRNWYV
jgi:hypothetical protein